MHIKNKRGQSTVEYVLLVTAVVAVIITLVAGNNSQFQTQLNSTLNQAISGMDTMAGRLAGSEPAAPSNTVAPLPPYTVNVMP